MSCDISMAPACIARLKRLTLLYCIWTRPIFTSTTDNHCNHPTLLSHRQQNKQVNSKKIKSPSSLPVAFYLSSTSILYKKVTNISPSPFSFDLKLIGQDQVKVGMGVGEVCFIIIKFSISYITLTAASMIIIIT